MTNTPLRIKEHEAGQTDDRSELDSRPDRIRGSARRGEAPRHPRHRGGDRNLTADRAERRGVALERGCALQGAASRSLRPPRLAGADSAAQRILLRSAVQAALPGGADRPARAGVSASARGPGVPARDVRAPGDGLSAVASRGIRRSLGDFPGGVSGRCGFHGCAVRCVPAERQAGRAAAALLAARHVLQHRTSGKGGRRRAGGGDGPGTTSGNRWRRSARSCLRKNGITGKPNRFSG